MYLRKSKFLIVGISKSGYNACKLLLMRGAECYLFDSDLNGKAQKFIKELIDKGAKLANKENIEDVISICDIVVLSPGVPIDNEIPILARRLKKNIIGELELGYYFTKSPIVAVTGTNGKTTTCSLIDFILKKAGINSCLAGNIGTPLTGECEKIDEKGIFVVEVSSYQLETIAKFTPHIACIINISPDHLTRHYNMDNYVYLKSRILRNLRESEFAVLNADDERITEFTQLTRAKPVFFSMAKEVDGAYLIDNKLYFKGEFIMDADKFALKGGHNLQNALVAICVCKLLGIEKDAIVNGLSEFRGVKHRIQEISRKEGIVYLNDSKSTNPASTISALSVIKSPTILLLGGREKGEGYDELFEKIKANPFIKEIIVYGECKDKLYNFAKRSFIDNVSVVKGFETAVKLAFLCLKEGYVLLLSPACSSFDEFENFEERGDRFIELVKIHTGEKK